MTESVAEVLDRLSFVRGSAKSLYLNEEDVGESFTTQFGAIESFTRTAVKDGRFGVDVKVVNFSTGKSSEGGVTWSIKDPIAKALVLQHALKSQNLLHGLDCTKPGCYISFAGVGLISRPDEFEREHREGLREHPGLYEELEAERVKTEKKSEMMKGQKSHRWLLTLSEGNSVCAATLDQRWIQPIAHHYVGYNFRWEIFGMFHRIVGTRVPFLVALQVSTDFPP